MNFPNIENKALLSPMADINDIAFRLLCKEYGCAMTYTQMVSASLAAKKNKSTLNIIDVIPQERPYAIQLFGQDADEISNAAIFIEEEYSPAVIDLNMGCPARKIVSQGSGSALLIKPEKIAEIVKKTSSVISIPFTVKIRLGQNEKNITALDVARICEDNGAAALAVHGRTAEQGYMGKADWSMIKQIKDMVSIPIIGNGDINTPHDAKRMLDETGCDYFMIARAAMKCPLIFSQVNDFLQSGSFERLTLGRKRLMAEKYLALADTHNIPPERVKVHLQHFTSGDPGGSAVRHQLSSAKSIGEIKRIVFSGKLNTF